MKYKCIPNKQYVEDPSCIYAPCILEVANSTPKPSACPYGNTEYYYKRYCKWEPIIE